MIVKCEVPHKASIGTEHFNILHRVLGDRSRGHGNSPHRRAAQVSDFKCMGLACRFWKERRVQRIDVGSIHNINAIRGNHLCTPGKIGSASWRIWFGKGNQDLPWWR